MGWRIYTALPGRRIAGNGMRGEEKMRFEKAIRPIRLWRLG